MVRGLRVFGGVLFFGIILTLTIVFLCHRLLVKSLPQTSGEVQLEILKNPVEVIRDEFGVPHIFAGNKYDMYVAAGYVAAQDRLWQMDLNRRIACGRLSEIFGAKTVEYDKFLRLWGFNRTATLISEMLSQESLLALTTYTYGINAFIKTHKEKLPIEFSLLDYTPEMWRVEDSIALSRFLAWQSSSQKYQDLLLADLLQRVDSGKLRELFPDSPIRRRYAVSGNNFSFLEICKPFLETEQSLTNFIRTGASLQGVAWVISGSKTASGKPILVAVMQDEPVMPSPWYQIHLSWGTINMSGLTVPGLPVFIVGHNDSIAWAANSAGADDIDFFVERIDSVRQTYFDGRAWQELKLIKEEVLVKDAKADSVKIVSTHNGPLISGYFPYSHGENQAISIRWSGFTPSDDLNTFLEIQESANWVEFLAALDSHKVPVLNFVFADTKGDVGYQTAGSVPVRRNSAGALPHNGWQRTGKWIDEIPFNRLPKILNPKADYFVSTKAPMRRPYYFSNPLNRNAEISLLDAWFAKDSVSVSVEDNGSLLQNIESVYAKRMLPQILQSVQAVPDSLQTNSLKMLTDLIQYWDGVESKNSVPASIFHAFVVKISGNIFKDEMGEVAFDFFIKNPDVVFRTVETILGNERSDWFDNILTDGVETKNDIINKSLFQAGEMLRDLAGEQVSGWRWGDLHQVTFGHQLGADNLLGVVFNAGRFSGNGSTMTMNYTAYSLQTPFEIKSVNSAIQIVDLSDLRHSSGVVAAGASGQPFSKHFKDQLSLWQNGEVHKILTDKKDLENQQVEHLTLSPLKN